VTGQRGERLPAVGELAVVTDGRMQFDRSFAVTQSP
jgi:hypothetical protein